MDASPRSHHPRSRPPAPRFHFSWGNGISPNVGISVGHTRLAKKSTAAPCPCMVSTILSFHRHCRCPAAELLDSRVPPQHDFASTKCTTTKHTVDGCMGDREVNFAALWRHIEITIMAVRPIYHSNVSLRLSQTNDFQEQIRVVWGERFPSQPVSRSCVVSRQGGE
jgi:hypothetical protein